jgi:hypothetical protein
MKYVILSVVILLLGLVWVCLSYFEVFMPTGINQKDWFASAGAVLAGCGVIAEFMITPFSNRTYIPTMVQKSSWQYGVKEKCGKWIIAIEIMAIIQIIIGSLIWGYAGFYL